MQKTFTFLAGGSSIVLDLKIIKKALMWFCCILMAYKYTQLKQ